MRRRKYLVVDGRMLFSSGIGVVIQNVLKEFSRMGVQESVFVNSQKAIEWCDVHLNNWNVEFCGAKIYSLQEQMLVPLLTRHYDHVWIPHYNIPLLSNRAFTATVHDVLHLVDTRTFSWVQRSYAKVLLASVSKGAKNVVCCSEFTAKELVRTVGCQSNKIRVVYNGVNDAWFSAENNNTGPKDYFLFVGNIKAHKNLKNLLRAFDRIKRKLNSRLVLVGKREGFITKDSEVERLAEVIGDQVSFTGWVSDDELVRWYQGARALIFPSFYEGFGLPPLEAMASGVPVLASSAAAIPEICGDAASYFDPGSLDEMAEKMLWMEGVSASERHSIIERGKKRASLFSWNRTASLMREALFL